MHGLRGVKPQARPTVPCTCEYEMIRPAVDDVRMSAKEQAVQVHHWHTAAARIDSLVTMKRKTSLTVP